MHTITLYVAGCIMVDKLESVFSSDLCHVSTLFPVVSITFDQTVDMFLMELLYFCLSVFHIFGIIKSLAPVSKNKHPHWKMTKLCRQQ